MIKAIVLAAVGLGVTAGTKLSSYGTGALFDKCISYADWDTKTIHDDITLVDRVANCCPANTLPGVQHKAQYEGGQVVCGFKADGTVSFTKGVTGCKYNNCYVVKLDLACTEGRQKINGCCNKVGDACKTNNCGFQANCENYYETNYGTLKYCSTFNTTYKAQGAGTEALTGTSVKTDDVTGTTLNWMKVGKYTRCGGGTSPSPGGSSPSPSPSSPSPIETGSASKMGLASVAAAMALAMGTLS